MIPVGQRLMKNVRYWGLSTMTQNASRFDSKCGLWLILNRSDQTYIV